MPGTTGWTVRDLPSLRGWTFRLVNDFQNLLQILRSTGTYLGDEALRNPLRQQARNGRNLRDRIENSTLARCRTWTPAGPDSTRQLHACDLRHTRFRRTPGLPQADSRGHPLRQDTPGRNPCLCRRPSGIPCTATSSPNGVHMPKIRIYSETPEQDR